MTDIYRTPEQKARDKIDAMLDQAGWKVQSKNKLDFSAGPGIAVREYQTDVGPADYVLFVGKQAVGVVEASRRSGAIISRPSNRSPALMLLPNSSGSTIKNPCRSYTNLPVGLRGLPTDPTRDPAPGRFSTSCDRKPYRSGTQKTTRFAPGFENSLSSTLPDSGRAR